MTTPALPAYYPPFIAESFATLKKWMSAKNRAQYVMLRFDRDMKVLSSKINIFKIFHFVLLRIKNIVDQRFQDFFQDFFLHGQ